MDLDFSKSVDKILTDIPGLDRDPSLETHSEYWMKLMKFRQKLVERKVDKVSKGIGTLTTMMQGAELMYKALQGDKEDLKSNSSEVCQRLKTEQ